MEQNITYQDFIQNILNTRGRFGISKGEYKERHHIIPKCIGGTNDKDNLIDLYAREHFIAHKLLAIETNNSKLICAWWNMCNVKNNNEIERYIPTPEEYEEARINFAKYLSETRSGENHPFYGKHHTEDSLIKISNKSKGENNPMYGIQCYYKMSEDEIEKWKLKLVLGSPKRKLVKCINTGIIYNSVREASRCTGVIRSHIEKSMLYNCEVDGYSFIEVDKITGEEIIKLSLKDLEDKINEQNKKRSKNQSAATKLWWSTRDSESSRNSALKGWLTRRKKEIIE